MGRSTFSGPIRAGTVWDNSTANVGNAVLSQTQTITQNGTADVSATFYLPANARICEFYIDTTVAWNSGTSDAITVGTAAAGTQYVSSGSVAATGRLAITHTAAQLLAMSNISTNTTLVATVTTTGTAATTGTTVVTVVYVQN